jgi:hypothetical protein
MNNNISAGRDGLIKIIDICIDESAGDFEEIRCKAVIIQDLVASLCSIGGDINSLVERARERLIRDLDLLAI